MARPRALACAALLLLAVAVDGWRGAPAARTRLARAGARGGARAAAAPPPPTAASGGGDDGEADGEGERPRYVDPTASARARELKLEGKLAMKALLPWEEAVVHAPAIRLSAVRQFIAAWSRCASASSGPFSWGDELEYALMANDPAAARRAQGGADGCAGYEDVGLDALHALLGAPPPPRARAVAAAGAVVGAWGAPPPPPPVGAEPLEGGGPCGVRLDMCALPLLAELSRREEAAPPPPGLGAEWHPEYGSWMVEATPAAPYGPSEAELFRVHASLAQRRAALRVALAERGVGCGVSSDGGGSYALSLTAYPLLGVQPHSVHPVPSPAPISGSKLLSDAAIMSNPRFAALTKNIRTRRGRQIEVRLPADTAAEGAGLEPAASAQLRGAHASAVVDCMAFGMGCGCLQTTYQLQGAQHALWLHDALAVLAPLTLALSAATPFVGGRVVSTDTRWDLIAAAVDDRTAEEEAAAQQLAAKLGLAPRGAEASGDAAGAVRAAAARGVPPGTRPLFKSRYDSSSVLLSAHLPPGGPEQPWAQHEAGKALDAELNDLAPLVDACVDPAHARLLDAAREHAGLPAALARHVGWVCARDPLVVGRGRERLPEAEAEHFELLQSTNWNSVRLKPPLKGEGGWRVELRPIEAQLTDFENAALATVSSVYAAAAIGLGLDVRLPASAIDENFRAAARRDGARAGAYWLAHAPPDAWGSAGARPRVRASLSEILSGSARVAAPAAQGGAAWPGLLPLLRAYAHAVGFSQPGAALLGTYCELLGARADGALPTEAAHLRALHARALAARREARRAAGGGSWPGGAAEALGEVRGACCDVLHGCRLLSDGAAAGGSAVSELEAALLGDLRVRADAQLAALQAHARQGGARAPLLSERRLSAEQVRAVYAHAHALREEAAAARPGGAREPAGAAGG